MTVRAVRALQAIVLSFGMFYFTFLFAPQGHRRFPLFYPKCQQLRHGTANVTLVPMHMLCLRCILLAPLLFRGEAQLARISDILPAGKGFPPHKRRNTFHSTILLRKLLRKMVLMLPYPSRCYLPRPGAASEALAILGYRHRQELSGVKVHDDKELPR